MYFNGQQRVRTKPDSGLRKIADETGGGYFELTKASELAPKFTKVAQELHSQYVIGFTPTMLDNKVHKLAVKMKQPGMTAQARRSYLAAGDKPSGFGTVVSCLLIFDRWLGFSAGEDVFAFGVFPFVVWGAVRFGARGAAAVSFLVSLVAVWQTAHGSGPFVRSGSLENATLLQSFLAVISTSGMMLAALITERAQTDPCGDRHARDSRRAKALSGDRRDRQTRGSGSWTRVHHDASSTGVWLSCWDIQWMRCSAGPYSISSSRRTSSRRGSICSAAVRGVSEQLEGRYRRKDGSELWARVSATPTLQ